MGLQWTSPALPSSFDAACILVWKEIQDKVDHFHAYTADGQEIILSDESGNLPWYAWMDAFGYRHDTDEFVRIEAHRFHGFEHYRPVVNEVDTYDHLAPERRPGWLERLMLRLVSW